MFRVQRRGCLICFVLRGEVFVMVLCDMFRVQRRGCVICFVFREEGV